MLLRLGKYQDILDIFFEKGMVTNKKFIIICLYDGIFIIKIIYINCIIKKITLKNQIDVWSFEFYEEVLI